MKIYNELISLFEKKKNEKNAIKMANYMKNKFIFYGIKATLRKKLTKDIIKKDKSNKIINWKLLDLCYLDEHREMQYFVNDYLCSMNKYLT